MAFGTRDWLREGCRLAPLSPTCAGSSWPQTWPLRSWLLPTPGWQSPRLTHAQAAPFSLSPRHARPGQTRGQVAGPKEGSWQVPGSVPLGGSVRSGANCVGSAQRSPRRQAPHAGKALRGGEGPGRFPLLPHGSKTGGEGVCV